MRSVVVRSCGRGHVLQRSALSSRRPFTTVVKEQADEPLRILFCGSEDFSIASLRALHKFKDDPASNILSIDVATRHDKPSGRGMKDLRPPPIKSVAAQLGLRLHQFDTFTGWHLPEYLGARQPYINLVIAVSFGLLVPPRILNSAKFGGLNIHPSMLPQFRGAAPLNWTIIDGHTHTGVSLQTLHPSKFDHGLVLDQTPEPGIAIPDPTKVTAHDLRLLLAPLGADMLVNALRNKLYLRPYLAKSATRLASHAPKILPSMKMFKPSEDYVGLILRKNRAMPRLWAKAVSMHLDQEETKRVIFGTRMRKADTEDLSAHETLAVVDDIPVGIPFALLKSTENISTGSHPIFVKAKGNGLLVIPDLLVAGAPLGPAAAAAAKAKLFSQPLPHGSLSLYLFHQPLITSEFDTQLDENPIKSPESIKIRRIIS